MLHVAPLAACLPVDWSERAEELAVAYGILDACSSCGCLLSSCVERTGILLRVAFVAAFQDWRNVSSVRIVNEMLP